MYSMPMPARPPAILPLRSPHPAPSGGSPRFGQTRPASVLAAITAVPTRTHRSIPLDFVPFPVDPPGPKCFHCLHCFHTFHAFACPVNFYPYEPESFLVVFLEHRARRLPLPLGEGGVRSFRLILVQRPPFSAVARTFAKTKMLPLLALLPHVPRIRMSSQLLPVRAGIVPHCFRVASIARPAERRHRPPVRYLQSSITNRPPRAIPLP